MKKNCRADFRKLKTTNIDDICDDSVNGEHLENKSFVKFYMATDRE